MKRFLITTYLLFVLTPAWGDPGAAIIDVRQAVETYIHVEFKGGDPSARRKIIKFSPARVRELKKKWPGILLYVEFSEHEPQYIVSDYKIKDVRVNGDRATADVNFQRLARTENIYGSRYIAETPHQETVTLNLVFDKNKWWVLDPPPSRISKGVLIEYYEYQVKEYSSIWEQKLNDPTYNERQKANVRTNRDQATGTLQFLKSLP